MSGIVRAASSPRRRRALVVFGIVLLALGFVACGSTGGSASTDSAPPDVIALGEGLYQANCATCHGAGGEGQPNWQSRRPDGTLPAPPHDASGHTWHHTDSLLLEIIERGGQAVYGGPGLQSGMPAFGDRLTAAEIEAVLEYIKTLWGETEREYQSALPEP